jgi:hypothetical protein
MGKVATPFWADPIKRMLRNQAKEREFLGTLRARKLNPAVYSSLTVGTLDAEPQVGPNNLRVVNGNSGFSNSTEDASQVSGPPSTAAVPLTRKPPGKTNSKLADHANYVSRVDEVSERPAILDSPPSPDGTVRIRNSIEIISIPDDVSTGSADHGHTKPTTSPSQLSNPMSINSSRGWLNTQAGLRLLSGYGPQSNFTDLVENGHPPRESIVLRETIPEDASTHDVSKPVIEPSIATLDRAASAKIYFENIYFPILRQPPSREQRRIALESDLSQMMHLTPAQKEEIYERWRRNETEYLRETRRKVSAEAFIRLKIIGHGAFGIVSLVKEKGTGQLYAMKQVCSDRAVMINNHF